MNKEELLHAAEVMRAAAAGKEIQYKSKRGLFDWRSDLLSPMACSWDWFSYDYRVRPDTIKYRLALLKDKTIGTCRNKENLMYWENRDDFVRWLTDWVEVEI